MRSTSQLRQVWHPPCQRQPPLTFTFWNGVRVGIDGRIIEALKALDACLKRWGYRPKEGQTWGYNCRRITGGTGYSLHAYGIAVDINSLANPYGTTLKTDMPPAMVAAIKAIKTNGGHRVWGWGGDYSRNKDAMHYEVVASPAELRTGIDWRTVGGTVATQSVTPTPALIEEDDMDSRHFDLDPGESIRLSVEPANGFFGRTASLLLLDVRNDDGEQPVWVWHQFTGGGAKGGPDGKVVVRGGQRFTRSVSGGWLDVRNDGTKPVFGALLTKRV